MKLSLKKGTEELFIKTSYWNSIIEVFESEKGINVSKYLVSITIKNDILIAKINNPILKVELFNFDSKIKERFYDKVKKYNISFSKYEVKYII